MKLKRSKVISVFFLLSFFVSISTNICLASIVSPLRAESTQTKDHLHLTEDVVTSNINDLLFEENENEDENEFEFDLSRTLIPFFLETFTFQTSHDYFTEFVSCVISPEAPIYI